MAGLEADVSSYNQPMPVGPLEQAGKIGALQSQSLQIDKQKLDLVSQHMAIANHELSILANDPDLSQGKVTQALDRIAKTTNMPLAVYQKMHEEYADAGNDPARLKQIVDLNLRRGMSVQEQLNNQYGASNTLNNNQHILPVSVSQQKQTIKPMGDPIQLQQDPNTETIDNSRLLPNGQPNPNYGARRALGPQRAAIPEGTLPVRGGLPGQYQQQPQRAPSALPTGPINNPAINGPSANFGGTVTGANVEAPTFNDRFSAARPAGVAKTLPPGAGEAIGIGAAGGATSAVAARQQAGNFQREIFPLTQAIPALEKLGPKGTGPGTETINHLKSFAISMVPGIKESDFNGTVADYDKAKKYLTDFVNQTGNSGTNDKLAAAFAGNPSVGISNAAAVDVAKSALSLRRLKQAEIVAFEKSNLPDQEFQKFSVRFNNEQDPRAYGVDLMSKDKLQKLIKSMSPEELKIFKASIEIAHNTKSIPALGSR